MAFNRTASLKIENPEVSIDSWVSSPGNVRTASSKIIDYKKIIADFNPDKFLLTHCTIVASVNVENAPKPVHFVSEKTKKELGKLVGKSDYYISPKTSKYMNANGDAWSRDLLKLSYKTFVGAENYVEHVQDPSLSKGKILDAVIREVDGGKSLFVDILVATDKKHSDLVGKIKTGELTTLSMGSVVAFTICTECGRVASDETELCHHIKYLKRNSFISPSDGKKRVIAELCGHRLYPDSNKFIEGSWVETPAFKGAVLRNEIGLNTLDEKLAFAEKYESTANIKSPDLRETASRIMNAFALVDKVQDTFKVGKDKIDKEDEEDDDGVEITEAPKEPKEDTSEPVEMKEPTAPEGEKPPIQKPQESPSDDDISESIGDEEPIGDNEPSEDSEDLPEEMGDDPTEEETPAEEPVKEEAPEEESAPDEDAPTEEPEEEESAPDEDAPAEEEPEEEEAPEEENTEEDALDSESKKPYDVLKEEIKTQLKDQIKKELLRDLGIDINPTKPAVPTLENVNLNNSLLQASQKNNFNKLKKASIIFNKEGLKGLSKKGYSRTDVLKIALLTSKYSINNEVFKAVDSLDFNSFSTFRRYAKSIEKVLGRELDLAERANLDVLLSDMG